MSSARRGPAAWAICRSVSSAGRSLRRQCEQKFVCPRAPLYNAREAAIARASDPSRAPVPLRLRRDPQSAASAAVLRSQSGNRGALRAFRQELSKLPIIEPPRIHEKATLDHFAASCVSGDPMLMIL